MDFPYILHIFFIVEIYFLYILKYIEKYIFAYTLFPWGCADCVTLMSISISLAHPRSFNPVDTHSRYSLMKLCNSCTTSAGCSSPTLISSIPMVPGLVGFSIIRILDTSPRSAGLPRLMARSRDSLLAIGRS